MATLTINIPNEVVDRVQDALCTRFGYDPLVDGTKTQFAKKQVARWIKEQVKEHEANTAGATASASAASAAESEITLT